MSGKDREQAAQRRTKATESIQQELQACAWSVGRRRPAQVCGDEPFKEGLYEMRPKQAVPLWPRKRKKREGEKERKEKKVFPLEWGMACWTWISNCVFWAAFIAQSSGREAREETVLGKSVTALEMKTEIYIYYYPWESASNRSDIKMYQSYLTE